MTSPTLEAIIEDRRIILEDILPLFAEGTREQMIAAAEALAKQEDSKYMAMMQKLEEQCDRYEKKVGGEFIRPYGLTAKDPRELRRYFIVRGYINPIAAGDERLKRMAAKRIATMKSEEYASAIQALRNANEHPRDGEEARTLLEEEGLRFIPIAYQKPQEGVYNRGSVTVYNNPDAVRQRQREREEAFALLYY